MRINVEIQYAILLALYLQRAGRAQLPDAAAQLSLSLSFLQQVSRKLVKAGVLASFRGRAGGYELSRPDVTIKDIFDALDPIHLISAPEKIRYSTGVVESRAFSRFASSLRSLMTPLLNKTVGDIVKELVAKEVEQREKAVETGVIQ